MFDKLNLNFPPRTSDLPEIFFVCPETKGSGSIPSLPVKDTFAACLAFRYRRKCPNQIRCFSAKGGKKECVGNIKHSSFSWGATGRRLLREPQLSWNIFLLFNLPGEQVLCYPKFLIRVTSRALPKGSLRAVRLMGQLRPLRDGARSSSGELLASDLLHERCPAAC